MLHSLLALLLSTVALAGWEDAAPFTAPAPALLQALEAAPEDERLPGVRILLEEHGFAYDEAGLETEVIYRVYGITQASMVDGWGISEASWAPWFQERPEVRVRIISAAGQEHLLTDAEMGEVVPTGDDPTMFTDGRMLRAPLPGVGVGAVVEERIIVREHQPFVAAGATHQVPLVPYRPAQRYKVWVEAPPSVPLRWEVREGEQKPSKRRSKGVRGIEFEVANAALDAPQDFLPSDQTGFPHLVFSTASSWADIGLTYYQRVAPMLDPTGLEPLVARLEEGSPEVSEQVDRAYLIARDELRYTGVEFGEQAVVPSRPSEAMARGYGDCKDKATLLVTLLAQVDIEARLALLRSGSWLDVAPDYPGDDAFDHVIVYVPALDRWLDPTSSMTPADQLPPTDAGRHALVVSPGGGKLVRTPEVEAASHYWREVRHVTVQPDGYSRVREEVEASGWPSHSLRYDLEEQSPEELRQNLQGYGLDTYYTDLVEEVSVSNASDVDRPVGLISSYSRSGIGGGGSEEASVWADASLVAAFLPTLLLDGEGLEERTAPVVFTPHVAEVVYDITLPPLYLPRDLPEAASHRIGSVEYSVSVLDTEQGIRVSWRLDGGEGVLTADEARELRALLLPLSDEVVLSWDQQGALWLAEGRVGEALALYDARIAAEPEEQLYRTWRTESLLDVGMGWEAKRSAEQAVQAHPEDPDAWMALGYARLHDDLGESFRHAFDHAGAVEAYEKVLDLAPDEPLALRNLAVLYEHDPDGRKYGPGCELETAAAYMERFRSDGERGELDVNLLLAHLMLGAPARVRDLATDMPTSVEVIAADLAALAMLSGVTPVKRAIRSYDLSPESRMEVLAAVASTLFIVRHYALSAEVLGLTEAEADNPLMIRQQAKLQATLRPWEEVIAEAEPAAQPALRVMAQHYLGVPMDPELLSPELRDVPMIFDPIPRAKLDDLPPAVFVDTLLGALVWTVEGPAAGPKLVVGRSADGSESIHLVVVRDKKQWRLRATTRTTDHMGWAGFQAMERGDEALSRWWLRWLLEARGMSPAQAKQVMVATESTELRATFSGAMVTLRPAMALPGLAEVPVTPGEEQTAERVRGMRLDALEQLDRQDERLALAEEWLADSPDNSDLWGHRLLALHALSRTDEALELVGQMRTRSVGGPLQWGYLYSRLDAPAEARSVWEAAASTGQLGPAEANSYAWNLLFEPADPALAAQIAEQGLAQAKEPDVGRLHTLAVAYARSGELQGALYVMGTAQRLSDEPLDGHWGLVVGDLANAFGLPEAAAQAYSRVPAGTGLLDSRHLIPER